MINTDTEEVYNLETTDDPSVVYVNLNTSLNPNDCITLSVQFCTDVPKQDYRFGYHEDSGKLQFLLTYCFPVLVMHEDGAWLEYLYISHAESNYHTPANYMSTDTTYAGDTQVNLHSLDYDKYAIF